MTLYETFAPSRLRLLLLPFFLFFALSTIAQKQLQPSSKVQESIYPKLNEPQIPSHDLGSLKSTGCNSSSGNFYLKKDSIIFYPHKIYRASDGFLLIAGEEQINYAPFTDAGFLMKCDDKGNIIWAKTYDSTNHLVNRSSIYYYDLTELQDGSILLFGGTNNLVSPNNYDLLLTRTDNSGNILWSKIYKSRLWGSGNGIPDYYREQQIKQDFYTGDIFVTGQHGLAGRSIIKLNQNNGTIMWSKFYQPPFNGTLDMPFGIDILANEIRSFAKFNASGNSYIGIYRINKLTGDTMQTKFLMLTDAAGPRVGFISPNPLTILNNGSYILPGGLLGYVSGVTPFYHAGVAELDSNLNFVKAYCFRNNIVSNGSTRITMYPDGSGMFQMLHYINGNNSDDYYTQFKNGNIIKRRIKQYSGEGIPNDQGTILSPDSGDMIIKLLVDSISKNGKIEFLKLHISDTSSYCLGKDDSVTFIQPISYGNVSAHVDSIGNNDFSEGLNKTLTAQIAPLLNYIPGCLQISLCDSLKLIASSNVLCPGIPLAITVRKNHLCGSSVMFNYDSTHVQSFTQVNDSTFNVVFNSSWQGYIYGSLGGCTNTFDSVKVNVIQSLSVLNLGPDTVLCPGNTILLNAKAGFATYKWQDGSTDSTFLVTQPGTYFVTTTNACGGIFSDTIAISPHAPISFDLGPDLSKCNNDSLTITAPPGFITYSWAPAYNINSTTSQTVKVFPAVDTMYSVKAEKTSGCFAYDSVRIKVFSSPKIDLGLDKSFCFGDSLVLNAGNGFSKYLWSTGETSQQIVARNAGSYSVTATTTNNCSSKDTMRIISVYPNPVVSLKHDSSLCAGSTRVLNAGNFISYLWNTGNTSQTISINNLGIYSVIVTDNNNCKGSDSVKIITLLSSPANFLPADTAVCSYGSLQLSAKMVFSNYLWNTNEIISAITVKQPGTYWLQVKDKNNCTGRDSIIVAQKQCLQGFFIANAFTPNADGKNDVFKPMLFGKVTFYEFSLYNQWGENIFKSSNLDRGWDGSYKGLMQDTNAFVWVCKYQFENEPIKIEKGTVLLLK